MKEKKKKKWRERNSSCKFRRIKLSQAIISYLLQLRAHFVVLNVLSTWLEYYFNFNNVFVMVEGELWLINKMAVQKDGVTSRLLLSRLQMHKKRCFHLTKLLSFNITLITCNNITNLFYLNKIKLVMIGVFTLLYLDFVSAVW